MQEDRVEVTTEPALGGNVPLRSANPSRGTNQSGVRAYNERLVLSLVRQHGALPKADIARLTGLSAMTTTTIMNRLEVDGLLTKQAKQRGRIGQPSIPFALNADGAFSLGLKIGRRSCELVLVDFLGVARERRREIYRYPVPGTLISWVTSALSQVTRSLSAEHGSGLPASGSPFRSSSGTGRRRSARRTKCSTPGARSTSRPRSPASQGCPFTSATTPPRPAGRS